MNTVTCTSRGESHLRELWIIVIQISGEVQVEEVDIFLKGGVYTVGH